MTRKISVLERQTISSTWNLQERISSGKTTKGNFNCPCRTATKEKNFFAPGLGGGGFRASFGPQLLCLDKSLSFFSVSPYQGLIKLLSRVPDFRDMFTVNVCPVKCGKNNKFPRTYTIIDSTHFPKESLNKTHAMIPLRKLMQKLIFTLNNIQHSRLIPQVKIDFLLSNCFMEFHQSIVKIEFCKTLSRLYIPCNSSKDLFRS